MTDIDDLKKRYSHLYRKTRALEATKHEAQEVTALKNELRSHNVVPIENGAVVVRYEKKTDVNDVNYEPN